MYGTQAILQQQGSSLNLSSTYKQRALHMSEAAGTRRRNLLGPGKKDESTRQLQPTESKPLLLPIKPSHCRQPSEKVPGSAHGSFASTLRNGSAPPKKIVGKGSMAA